MARAFSQLRETRSHREHVIPIHQKGHYPQGLIAFCSVLFLSPASPSLPVSLVFWIHAAALKECLTELEFAFGSSSFQCQISVSSIVGHLKDLAVQRIDICGGTSIEVLERALSLDSRQLRSLKEGTAVFFKCRDPRIWKGTVPEHSQHQPSRNCKTQTGNAQSAKHEGYHLFLASCANHYVSLQIR